MGITLGAAFNFGESRAELTKSPVLFSSLSLTEFGLKIECPDPPNLDSIFLFIIELDF
jgi:hypothetical protein